MDLGLKSHPEEYESKIPDTKKLLTGLSGRALFILSGASLVSGASLRRGTRKARELGREEKAQSKENETKEGVLK